MTPFRLPAPALLLVAAAAALALAPVPAAAHGFLSEPPSRPFWTNWRYCPHCLNNGGPANSSAQGTLVWPQSTHPICGTVELQAPMAIKQSYVAGAVIDLKVFFSTQHGGRHTFRLCPRPQPDKPCFEQTVLQRADGGGPYSWTPVRGGPVPVPGVGYEKVTRANLPGEEFTFRYRLPPGLTCEHCVLQWWWTTANSCRVPGAPDYVGSDLMAFCNTPGPFPEEFYGCADIRIGDGTDPVPAPPAPSPPPPRPQPPPPAAGAACNAATAAAFCATKPPTDAYYANQASGCTCFFRCASGGRPPTWGTCTLPQRFSNAAQACRTGVGPLCG